MDLSTFISFMSPFLVLGILVDVFIYIIFCLEIYERNSVDPDQTPRFAASEQGPYSLEPYTKDVF